MADHDTAAVLALTTIPADFDAEGLAHRLLDRRLVACVNVLPPMRSVYRWQGSVESADERQVLMKTRLDQVAALEAAILAEHPYEVPEFLVIPVSAGGRAYLAWIAAEASGC